MSRTKKKNNASLATVGERGFLKTFLPRLIAFQSRRFDVLPGDDAAVLRGTGRPVLSIDGLTEGTHFRSSWERRCQSIGGFSLARGLGWKLLGSGLSDLAAMGRSSNRWAMIYLGAPGSVRLTFLNDFYRGLRDTAERYHCALAGGDTVKARDTSLVAAVGGMAQGRVLTRSGARAGDLVCIAGTVGDAMIGLRVLKTKTPALPRAEAAYFVKRFFQHTPMFDAGAVLSREPGVTSLLDLSDSIQDTMNLLSAASHVGIDVEISQIPVSQPYARRFKKSAALVTAGEDYALLFTVRPNRFYPLAKKMPVTIVGQITRGRSIRYFNHGRPVAVRPGFEHFR